MMTTQEKIASILREEDIEGLIEIGAPQDEYDAEAEMISRALSSQKTELLTLPKITTIITLIWGDMFQLDRAGIEQRLPAFSRVAAKIMQ